MLLFNSKSNCKLSDKCYFRQIWKLMKKRADWSLEKNRGEMK
jgi:hypothetical protein